MMFNRYFKLQLLMLLILGSYTSAEAASLTVTSTADAINASDGVCTLREAIISANTNTASGTVGGECSAGDHARRDAIALPAGTYLLTTASTLSEDASASGDLDFTENVTITGEGSSATIIDASSLSTRERVIHILNSSAALYLEGMTIQGGYSSDGIGGGIYLQSGRLNLTDCAVINNTAENTGVSDAAAGGGIYVNSGHLDIIGSIISNNTVTSSLANLVAGAGIFVHPYGDTFVSIRGSTISDNSATSNNIAGVVAGGGIFYYNGSSYSTANTSFELERSTVSGNRLILSGTGTADATRIAAGGGIFLATASSSTYHVDFTISNSTITSNEASNESSVAALVYAAGILSNISDSDSSLTVQNSTITENALSDSSGINAPYGGGIVNGVASGGGLPSLRNTIIANNVAQIAEDCNGTMTSYGYNLIKNIADCDFTAMAGDLTGIDPLLSDLGEHGGPTATLALQSNSPAIDTGSCTTIAGDAVSPDQRYQVRVEPCDIGAYEVVCGDGDTAGFEQCDDSNRVDGDDCSSTCTTETACVAEICGDGIDQDCDGSDATCATASSDSSGNDESSTSSTESTDSETDTFTENDPNAADGAVNSSPSGCSLSIRNSQRTHVSLLFLLLLGLVIGLRSKYRSQL